MKKILLIFFIINFNNLSFGSIKENIINNLKNIDNLSFNFEQNINGKIEKGNCIIEYPKKIFCKLFIIFSFIDPKLRLLKFIIKKINKIFFIKERLFYQHDLLY